MLQATNNTHVCTGGCAVSVFSIGVLLEGSCAPCSGLPSVASTTDTGEGIWKGKEDPGSAKDRQTNRLG